MKWTYAQFNLTQKQMRLGEEKGRERRLESLAMGLKEYIAFKSEQDAIDSDVRGVLGEIAMAVYLGFPDFVPGHITRNTPGSRKKFKLPDVFGIHVRTAKNHTFGKEMARMFIRPWKNDQHGLYGHVSQNQDKKSEFRIWGAIKFTAEAEALWPKKWKYASSGLYLPCWNIPVCALTVSPEELRLDRCPSVSPYEDDRIIDPAWLSPYTERCYETFRWTYGRDETSDCDASWEEHAPWQDDRPGSACGDVGFFVRR